jgi:hypothetical protein
MIRHWLSLSPGLFTELFYKAMVGDGASTEKANDHPSPNLWNGKKAGSTIRSFGYIRTGKELSKRPL